MQVGMCWSMTCFIAPGSPPVLPGGRLRIIRTIPHLQVTVASPSWVSSTFSMRLLNVGLLVLNFMHALSNLSRSTASVQTVAKGSPCTSHAKRSGARFGGGGLVSENYSNCQALTSQFSLLTSSLLNYSLHLPCLGGGCLPRHHQPCSKSVSCSTPRR